MISKDWKCGNCGRVNLPSDAECSNCGKRKPKFNSLFLVIGAAAAVFIGIVIVAVMYMLRYPEKTYRTELSKACSDKEITENGDILPVAQARLDDIKTQFKIANADARDWAKEEVDRCVPPPPLPVKAVAKPDAYSWTAPPEPIEVASTNAAKIYYTMEETLDGSLPPDPPEPTENSPFLGGSSSSFKIEPREEETKKVKVRFRGANRSGLGPSSEIYSYSVNLKPKAPPPDPEKVYRTELSKACSDKEITGDGIVLAAAQARLDQIKDQFKIADADARSWAKEEVDRCVPPPPLPVKAVAKPDGFAWKAAPEPIQVASTNARKIYYTMEETLDGSTPPDPPEPTENSRSLDGSSSSFKIESKAEEIKKVRVRFRGANRSGLGPSSETYSYSVDLKEPSKENLNKALLAQAHTLVEQALVCAKDKDYDCVISYCSASIEKHPTGHAYLNRAVAYMQKNMYNKALSDLQTASELDPRNPTVYYNMAAAYSIERQIDLALDALDQALDAGFNNFDVLKKDPDLKNLRLHPDYRKILEKHKIFLR